MNWDTAPQELEDLRAQVAALTTTWTGCGKCDCDFPCYEGSARCIRLSPLEPAKKYVCEICGFEDDKELRDGVNNHWRKGYKPGLRPTIREAICYGHTKPAPQEGTTHPAELSARETPVGAGPDDTKPVAWLHEPTGTVWTEIFASVEGSTVPLYRHPPCKQEPVAWMSLDQQGGALFLRTDPLWPDAIPLYLHPAATATDQLRTAKPVQRQVMPNKPTE